MMVDPNYKEDTNEVLANGVCYPGGIVDRTSPPAETPQQVTSPSPASNSPVDGIPTFESQWEAFITSSERPEIYNSAYKAVAAMGYSWAMSSFYKFGKAYRPKP